MASKLSKFLGGLVGPADGGGGEPGGPATEYKGFDIRSDSAARGLAMAHGRHHHQEL